MPGAWRPRVMVGGVIAALLGAVLLAFGAQLQDRGVRSVDRPDEDGSGGFGLRRVTALLSSGGWLLGTGFLTLAILLQLVGLLLAPLPVVQRAYASGSADLVVAALTVVDPLVAVSLGIGLLGQAADAPGWAFAVFAAAEAVAIVGVVLISRNQPIPAESAR